MTQWDLDARALESADRHYLETLAMPDLRGLTDGLVPMTPTAKPIIADLAAREIYVEMVREVQDLLRDIRFLTGAALMLLFDASSAQEAEPVETAEPTPGLFISEAELAVLLTNDHFQAPSTLATDRHRHIGGGQSLGAWFGGQLLDTALTKCHGLLDRLVVALWCRAELPIATTKAGEKRYPTFNKDGIKGLATAYHDASAWEAFSSLIDTPLARELVRYRHDGMHKRRAGSAFNGGLERWHADDDNTPEHRVIRGMTAIEHANAPLATYQELVLPALMAAVEMTKEITAAEQ